MTVPSIHRRDWPEQFPPGQPVNMVLAPWQWYSLLMEPTDDDWITTVLPPPAIRQVDRYTLHSFGRLSHE